MPIHIVVYISIFTYDYRIDHSGIDLNNFACDGIVTTQCSRIIYEELQYQCALQTKGGRWSYAEMLQYFGQYIKISHKINVHSSSSGVPGGPP